MGDRSNLPSPLPLHRSPAPLSWIWPWRYKLMNGDWAYLTRGDYKRLFGKGKR